MKMYEIEDKIYGKFKVPSIINSLIISNPIQRLKKIHQGGGAYLVNKCWNTKRYDHSIGVLYLSQKLGGSLDENIKSLIHDVSHTAFSHVIDYVIGNEYEDYHDSIFENIIKKTEINSILRDANIDIDSIIKNKFFILDSDLPDLSVDRIDYTLRDLYNQNLISKEKVLNFLEELQIFNGSICIKSESAALWFLDLYYKEVLDFFMHPLNIYANYKLTELLDKAMKFNIITFKDFQTTDQDIIDKIEKSKNKNLISILNEINPKVQLIEDNEEYNINIKFKPRILDPYLIIEGKKIRLTSVNKKAEKLNEKALKSFEKEMKLKIIKGEPV